MRRVATTVAILLLFAASALHAQSMLVSTGWLQASLNKVKVVEVGDRTAYDSGHIPGAVLVEFQSIVTTIDGIPYELPPIDKLETVFRNAGVGETGRIVLYSRDPLHSARAFFTLDYLGHGARASVLDGGFAKWTEEGRPVSKEAAAPAPSTFQAQVHPAALTRLRTMKELVRNRGTLGANLVVIDARPVEQFTGTQPGPDVKCPGRIPGAVNIPSAENFSGGAAPVFRSVDELRALYEGAGVTKTSANVLYCRTGMHATITYFVLKYLGYDATLYDGSFVEWSNTGQIVE